MSYYPDVIHPTSTRFLCLLGDFLVLLLRLTTDVAVRSAVIGVANAAAVAALAASPAAAASSVSAASSAERLLLLLLRLLL